MTEINKNAIMSIKILNYVDMIPQSTKQGARQRQNLLVSAGGFPLVMVLTEPGFILVILEWSVELGFDH